MGKLKSFIKRKIAEYAEKHEQTFTGSNGVEITYFMRMKHTSTALAVIFSGWTPEGYYNYVNTIMSCPVNALFIKDNKCKNGTYYLGQGMEEAISELIRDVFHKIQPSEIYFIGSSKGGYAALTYGLPYPEAHFIIASPQYFIGDYMMDATKFHPGLEYICQTPLNQITPQQLQTLNTKLQKAILADNYGPLQKCHLHLSKNDKTYELHCKTLVEDLRQIRMPLVWNEDEYTYTEHHDLKHYFPKLIKSVLRGRR